MTRTILILGLVLLAACLPLAVLPLVTVVLFSALLLVAHVVPFAGSSAQPVALRAVARFRVPPSH